jgi:lysophospholipase L1-like esterase
MPKIKLRRGKEANLPLLEEGEPGYTTDTGKLFVGGTDGNVEMAKKEDITSVQQELTVMEGKVNETNQRFDDLALVDANAEVLNARGTDATLGDRLNNFSQQMAQRPTQEEVNAMIGNISDGTPLFASNLAGMTDTTRLYVNTSDGLIYVHNGTSFISTGRQYQSTGIANKGIKKQHLGIAYQYGVVAEGKINIDTANSSVTISEGAVIITNDYYYIVSESTATYSSSVVKYILFNVVTSNIEIIQGRPSNLQNSDLIYLGAYYRGSLYGTMNRNSFLENGKPFDTPQKEPAEPTEPNEVSYKERYTFSKAYKDWLKGEKAPIVFLSDSTTDGSGTTGHSGNSVGIDKTSSPNAYVPKLQQLLREETGNSILRMYNAGFAGRQADWAYDNIEAIMTPYTDAKIVVIGYGINDRRTDLQDYYNRFYTRIENLINWCLGNGYQPALMTTQAIVQVGLDTTTHDGRSAESVQSIANQVKYELANKYDLELIDVNRFTSDFLNYSEYPLRDIIVDDLHFGDVGHKYESEMFFSHIVPRVEMINNKEHHLISLINQRSKSEVIGNITDSNGRFKVIFDFAREETDELTLQDVWIFNNTKGKISVIGHGNADVYINDILHPVTDGKTHSIGLDLGLHHLVAKTTSTNVYWEGFEVS